MTSNANIPCSPRQRDILDYMAAHPGNIVASDVADLMLAYLPGREQRKVQEASTVLGDLYRQKILTRQKNTDHPYSRAQFQYALNPASNIAQRYLDDGVIERAEDDTFAPVRKAACNPVIETGYLAAVAARREPPVADGREVPTLVLNAPKIAVLADMVQADIEYCTEHVASRSEHYDDVLEAAQRLALLVELRQQLRDLGEENPL